MSDTLTRPSRLGIPLGPRRPEPEHAPCRGCQGPVLRREGEAYNDHQARHTCSSECGTKAKATSKAEWAQVWADLEAMHPPCVICTAPVLRRPDESRAKYVGRLNCGVSTCKKACRSIGGHTPYQPGVDPDDADYAPSWPTELVEIDYGAGFGGRDVVDRERGLLLRLDRPETVTRGGVGSRWMAG